jgi:hypothetical protein
MADKETALSIVLRAVDKATATIRAVNKKIDEVTKPTRDFGKALSELGEKSGFDAVLGGFRDVGGAAKDLAFKVLGIGFAVGEAAHLLLDLTNQFAMLGHTAKRAGVEVDFLAGLRYAAEKSGISVEQLDSGVTSLTQNLGQMKAGTGRAFKFITEHVSGVFARQLTGAHGTAEAIGLIADAIAKLPDAERRAALTQKLFGDNALAPFLAKGSKGIQELMGAFAQLSPSQQGAVDGALGVEDAMVDMRAAADGVKAALVTGLSPALKVIVEDLKDWLVGHRGDIRAWAEDIGKKLPGAVDAVVAAAKAALADVTGFVDAIGGWKVAAVALAAVMTGPLVASILSVSATLLATPFGWVLLSIAAITVAIIELIKHWKEWRSISGVQDAVQQVVANPQLAFDRAFKDGRFKTAEEIENEGKARAALGEVPALPVPSAPNAPLPFSPEVLNAAIAALQRAPGETKIKVDFNNAPNGMRASIEGTRAADVDLNVGHQLGGTP